MSEGRGGACLSRHSTEPETKPSINVLACCRLKGATIRMSLPVNPGPAFEMWTLSDVKQPAKRLPE